jgi:hypothetical protein
MLSFRESSYEVTTILYPAVARQAIRPAARSVAARETCANCAPVVRGAGAAPVLEKQPIVDWQTPASLTDSFSTANIH